MERLRTLMEDGVAEGVFPGATLIVSKMGRTVFSHTAGWRRIVPTRSPLREDTIFDLASLTKPLITTSAVMSLIDSGKLSLDDTLPEVIPSVIPEPKQYIRIGYLLSHCSGMPAWHPFYLALEAVPKPFRKTELRRMLCALPLEALPSVKVLYSDLGFMILEWVVECLTSMDLSGYITKNLLSPLGLKRTFLLQSAHGFPNEEFAATEECPWRRRILEGETHDENAWALGGFSGHAGLFGTAGEVNFLLNLLLSHYKGKRRDFFRPDTVREFFELRDSTGESSWALGWDTPSPTGSSSGRFFSKKSVGHLGFTGTSVWIDLQREICVTLLTNRVHPKRENIKIRSFRPLIHDMVMEQFC